MGFLDKLKPQPRWKHADPAVRLEAVRELEDAVELAQLAETDPDARVRRAAVPGTQDPEVLGRVASNDADPETRDRAADRLVALATTGSDEVVAVAAVQALADTRRLSTIARAMRRCGPGGCVGEDDRRTCARQHRAAREARIDRRGLARSRDRPRRTDRDCLRTRSTEDVALARIRPPARTRRRSRARSARWKPARNRKRWRAAPAPSSRKPKPRKPHASPPRKIVAAGKPGCATPWTRWPTWSIRPVRAPNWRD